MGMWYFSKIVILVPFTESNVKKILEQGSKHGYTYFSIVDRRNRFSEIILPEKATTEFMGVFRIHKNSSEYSLAPRINFKELNTYLGLEFESLPHEIGLSLKIRNCGEYKEPGLIDFDQSLRILLNFSQGFNPIWLHAIDEYSHLDMYCDHNEDHYCLKDRFDMSLPDKLHITVSLFAEYSYDHLYKFIQQGTIIGWNYFLLESELANSPSDISVKQVVDYILEQSPKGQPKASVFCTIDHEKYQLSLNLRAEMHLTFSLSSIDSLIDFTQIALRALDLCTNYCIAEFNTFDARYNYIITPSDEVL